MCTDNNTSKDSCCQSGRSMIEILAVICLIVLLSVGSLLLYSYVIAKNQANTIQTMSNERAASIMTSPALASAAVGEVLSALGFADEENGYNWKQTKLSKDTFVVNVSVVRKKACEILLGMDFSYLERMEVNGKCAWAPEGDVCDYNAECLESGNEFAFIYNGLSLRRAAVCTKQQTPCGLTCCNQGTHCIKSGGRGSFSRCCLNATDVACEGGCCPKGATCCGSNCCEGNQVCCNDACHAPCVGEGLSGQRDGEDCSCACDETKGFRKIDGVCRCEANKHVENGECVCDSVACDTSTGAYIDTDCQCKCPAGKVSAGGGRCVECVSKDDCNAENCEECIDNECKGQCCIDAKDSCSEGDKCCDNLPCTDGVCCAGTKASCGNEDDCCNDDFSCTGGVCCAPKGVECSAPTDCCDESLGCDKTTGSESVCCVLKQSEGCDTRNDCCGGIACTDGTCCTDRKDTCTSTDECCYNLPCTDGSCCAPLGNTCESVDDCCLGEGKKEYACQGTCCVPFGELKCKPISEEDTKGYCCGDYSCVNEKCCLPLKTEGCSDTLQDCCGDMPCTDGKCCVPLKAQCNDATECCDESNACTVAHGEETVCCIPKKGTGCGTDDESCCNGMTCTDNMCCVPLQKACEAKDECCNEKAECDVNVKKVTSKTETVCCLPLQQQGCSMAEDCCNGISCTGDTCCIDVAQECTTSEECCGYDEQSGVGKICKENVDKCCSSDGWCELETECEACCTHSETPECSWERTGSSATAWVGKCKKPTSTEKPVYGYDPVQTQEMRCCTEGEYLVPTFTSAISQQGQLVEGEMFCCPDRNGEHGTVAGGEDDVMKYAYYSKAEGKCMLLDECPTPYDGVVLILDMSGSMKSGKPNYYEIVKDSLKDVFNQNEYDWKQIKVGIYTYGSGSETILKYDTYSQKSLILAVDSLQTKGDTCTGCGLKEAIEGSLGRGDNAPLFILMTDGAENVYPGTGNKYCGLTRGLYLNIKNAGLTPSYCMTYEGEMRGINVPVNDDYYVVPQEYTSSGSIDGPYVSVPASFRTYPYIYTNSSGQQGRMDVTFSMTAITKREVVGNKVVLRGYDDNARFNASGNLVYKTDPSAIENKKVYVRTEGTLTSDVYKTALDYVKEIMDSCDAFGGYNILAYSIGANYLSSSGIRSGVLTDADSIRATFADAFRVFENCIPPKEAEKCD